MAQYHGILNLNKPIGWTSHDVVAKVRRLLGQREVGHAGTLDPLATGVLLTCVGRATRVAEYLMGGEKVYHVTCRLGITTDTYDTDGQIVAVAPVPALTEDELRVALSRFVGQIQQRPPAYSAIKQDGVPAYRRARRGEQMELAPRPVAIREIVFPSQGPSQGAWLTPDLTFEVTCSAGTYVRSLVHDLGQALGCGAAMTGLSRLASGRFTLADAVTLDALADAADSGQVGRYLWPLSAALEGFTPIPASPEIASRLSLGQPIPADKAPGGEMGYALGQDGELLAIVVYDHARQQWRPRKVFA